MRIKIIFGSHIIAMQPQQIDTVLSACELEHLIKTREFRGNLDDVSGKKFIKKEITNEKKKIKLWSKN